MELTRGGQVDRAASLLPRITTTQVKAQALGQMGLELVRRGNPNAARTYLIQAAMTASDTVYPPLELARTLAAEGEPDLALAMLSALSDGEYKARGLNELAVSYAQAGDAATTREVLRQALQAADAIPEDYRQAEMVQEILRQAIALEVYEVAFEIRQNPAYNVFDPFEDYTAIAIAAAHSGQFETAQKALAKIDPSYIGYADRARFAIAVAYAETGQFEEALATAEAMNQSYARYIHALAAIAVRYQQAGKTEDAAATLARAEREISDLFTPEEPLIALNDIALEFAKAKQPERAARFLPKRSTQPTLFLKDTATFQRWRWRLKPAGSSTEPGPWRFSSV
ncbi:MAG: hypothetical protein HC925_05950 [Coleofasciculaceae cyanobacterium SM2_3_26]|nr:hypothetical protein [Coleofasciculaceae cyanobacterium SM2_3_26]